MKTRSYGLLREKMSSERRVRNEARTQTALIYMALQELCQSLSVTQQDLAKTLELSQPALSKMEHQEDIQVSTLAGYIEALGGQLKLVASFPDQEVVINQFEARK
ncbi:MAG: XRE family transcriptional regulator [Acaryochloridaceae cyanobacterium RU_4_10]|nr:XRE family transcriptional regulator [Acaryochloridaceae cyanobacterium RU_4_10]